MRLCLKPGFGAISDAPVRTSTAKYGRGAVRCGDQYVVYVALKTERYLDHADARIMFIASTTELHNRQDASKDAPLQTV